jgi:hypothetical protein
VCPLGLDRIQGSRGRGGLLDAMDVKAAGVLLDGRLAGGTALPVILVLLHPHLHTHTLDITWRNNHLGSNPDISQKCMMGYESKGVANNPNRPVLWIRIRIK